MVSLDKIREDLREVRYYYTRKELFDETFKSISTNVILEKVYRYNEAIRSAPVRLYDLYVCLYTKKLYASGARFGTGLYNRIYPNASQKVTVVFADKNLRLRQRR